jgi:hypothetical protein
MCFEWLLHQVHAHYVLRRVYYQEVLRIHAPEFMLRELLQVAGFSSECSMHHLGVLRVHHALF